METEIKDSTVKGLIIGGAILSKLRQSEALREGQQAHLSEDLFRDYLRRREEGLRDLRGNFLPVSSEQSKISVVTNAVKEDEIVGGSFGEKLETYRHRRGLSRVQLSNGVGINQSHLYRLETGGRFAVRRETMGLLISALDLTENEAIDLILQTNLRKEFFEFNTELEPKFRIMSYKWPIRTNIRRKIELSLETKKVRQELFARRLYDDYQEKIERGLIDILGVERSLEQEQIKEIAEGNFAQQLIHYRQSIGLTRARLAEMIHADQSHIFRLEKGDRMPGKKLVNQLVVALYLNPEQAEGLLKSVR